MTKYTVTLLRADGSSATRVVTAYSAAMAEKTARVYFGKAAAGDVVSVQS